MVTVNPARICKWDPLLGSLEAGKLADIVAVNGAGGNQYEHLLNARSHRSPLWSSTESHVRSGQADGEVRPDRAA